MKYFLSLLFAVLFFGCDKNDGIVGTDASDAPNILFIIADDMGKDATPGFSEGSIKPNTPNLER